MPSTIKIRVAEARGLPVMDKKSKLADTYVQIKFGEHKKMETSICWKTLNPVWEEDFRIEVADDVALQDTPVQFSVWDNDALKDDSVGSVIVELNNLLEPDSPGKISGWFPLFDTLQGIRGMLRIKVKVHFVNDVNPFKDSSAGVRFFSASSLDGYVVERIHGFVEELILKDDPEYSIYDSFRTSRKSNEARQLLLKTLSSQVRRNVGRKAMDLGGNAVLGYQQLVDLEEAGGAITARGYGTACSIKKVVSSASLSVDANSSDPANHPQSAVPRSPLHQSSGMMSAAQAVQQETAQMYTDTVLPEDSNRKWKGEVHLLTLSSLPANVRFQLAGVVSAKSIKLLDSRDSETARREERDLWWSEVRSEVSSHARALNCPYVVGYTETTSIFEDICVLSAYGTAVLLHKSRSVEHTRSRSNSLDDKEDMAGGGGGGGGHAHSRRRAARRRRKKAPSFRPCTACHVPYEKATPYTMTLARCALCHKKLVPEVLLSTTEPIDDQIPILGKGRLVEARVCRPKFQPHATQDSSGEAGATVVSEGLPFLEHALHTQLLYKLRVMGMNAAFNIRIQVVVGPELMAGVISATAVYLTALPPPPTLSIRRFIEVKDAEDENFVLVQSAIEQLSASNQAYWENMLERWNERCLKLQHAAARNSRMPRRMSSVDSSPTKSPLARARSGDVLPWGDSDVSLHPLALGPTALANTHTPPQQERLMLDRSATTSANEQYKPSPIDGDGGAFPSSSPALSTPGPHNVMSAPVSAQGAAAAVGSDGLNRLPLRRHVTAPTDPRGDGKRHSTRGLRGDRRFRFDAAGAGPSMGDDSENSDSTASLDEDVLAAARNQKAFVMQIDDDTDEDIMAVLLEPTLPEETVLCNSQLPPGLKANRAHSTSASTSTGAGTAGDAFTGVHWGTLPEVDTECTNEQLINAVSRVEWADWDPQYLNQLFANVFLELHTQIAFRARFFSPCCITNVTTHVSLPDENMVEVILTAMIVSLRETPISLPSTPVAGQSGSSWHAVSAATSNPTTPLVGPVDSSLTHIIPIAPTRDRDREREREPHKSDTDGEEKEADAVHSSAVQAATDAPQLEFGRGYPRLLPSLRRELMMDEWEQWKISTTASNDGSAPSSPESRRSRRTRDSADGSGLDLTSAGTSRVLPAGQEKQELYDEYDEEEDAEDNAYKVRRRRGGSPSSSSSDDDNAFVGVRRSKKNRDRDRADHTLSERSSSSSSTDTEEEFWEEERRREQQKFLLQQQAFAQGHGAGNTVECTPLSFVPGKRIVQYLGRVDVFLIEEKWLSGRDRGALGSFTHRFLREANAVARATVATRGGNALVAYTINTLRTKVNRDQAYSIVSISGDAILVVEAEDED